MLNRLMVSVMALTLSIGTVLVSAADQNWVLRTEWTEKKTPTLEYFSTKEAVNQEIRRVQANYGKGGILQYDTDRPTNFRYWYESGLSTGRVPADSTSVDAMPSSANSRSILPGFNKLPESIHGTQDKAKPRRWVMWLEQLKDGSWAAVPNRRFEYSESEGVVEAAFQSTLKSYQKAVESENARMIRPVRYRVQWELVGADQSSISFAKLAGEWYSNQAFSGRPSLKINADGTVFNNVNAITPGGKDASAKLSGNRLSFSHYQISSSNGGPSTSSGNHFYFADLQIIEPDVIHGQFRRTVNDGGANRQKLDKVESVKLWRKPQ